MIRKLISIVVAIAINCAVLAWFYAWSASAIASAAAVQPRPSVTLPVIDVHPSAAQLHALQRDHVPAMLPTAAKRT